MLMRSPLARDRRKPPGFIRPCQPVFSAKVPIDDGWIHKLKHNGFRIVALKDGDEVRLWSRHGRNWSAEFVAITAAVMALPFARVVLDGGAVAHCPKGLPDFHALLSREGTARACLYAFDLLHLDCGRPADAGAHRAPRAAAQAPQARGSRAHLQRWPNRRGRRGDVSARLPHGA